jgi:drug/metabolite transporter (DMT)-like permease
MIKKLHSHFFGESVMMLVTLLWGATFVIVKESLNDASPMLFIAMRFTIAGILLSPFIFKKKIPLIKSELIPALILGLLLFGGFATQTIGLKYTSATKSGFLTGSAVVIIPILQTIIEKRKPSRGSLMGIFLVFVGILFMSSGGRSIITFAEELGTNFNVGDIFTLGCALFFALYVVYLDVVSKRINFHLLLFSQIVVCAVMGFLFSGIFSFFNLETFKVDLTENLLFGLFYTAVFATLVTTSLQTKYQKLISPTKAGIIFSFEPVFAALIAFFAINEKFTMFGFIGGVLIFLGLLTSEIFDSKSRIK